MANQLLAEVEKALEAAPREDSLTLPDVIVTTTACLAVAVVAAVPGWRYLATNFVLYLGLIVVLMIAGIAIARRSPVKAPLALGYMVLLGLMVGAFSHAAVGQGGNTTLITQAILGTLAGVVGVLAVYATPIAHSTSPRVLTP